MNNYDYYGNMNNPYYQQPLNQYSYVNGIEGAKAFQLTPNKSILLMDSERPVFYFKTCNQMGQSSIKTYKFEEIEENAQNSSLYVTVEQFNELKAEIAKLGEKRGGKNE